MVLEVLEEIAWDDPVPGKVVIAYRPFMTLFITGPKIRDWGFWCDKGTRFVPWEKFTKNGVPGERGSGCD